jgi:hypothetical protein
MDRIAKERGPAMTTSPQVDSAPTSYQKNGRQREKVLVVFNSDGFVECYASKHVDIYIATKPHASTSVAEILAQEYVDLAIPRAYRDVFFPSYCRAAEQLRRITAGDILNRQHDVELLRGIQTLGDDRKGGYKR